MEERVPNKKYFNNKKKKIYLIRGKLGTTKIDCVDNI